MKVITVVLRPAVFDALKEALARFGVRGMTVAQVYLVTEAAERVEMYRGQRFSSDFQPSLRVDLLSPDDEVADLVRVIDRVVGGHGEPAACRWTTPVDWLVRVRTGEYGLDAL